MSEFIVHANSVCHVTHLMKVEAESEEDALEAYEFGGLGDLIGVQIHDSVGFLEPAPDTVSEQIEGIYIPYPDPNT